MFLFLFYFKFSLNLSIDQFIPIPLLGNTTKHRSNDLIQVYIGKIGIPGFPKSFQPLYKSTLLCSSYERQRKTKPNPHEMIGRKPEFISISFKYGFNTEKTEFCHETFRKTQMTFLNKAIENNIQYEFLIDKYAIWVPIGIMGSPITEKSIESDNQQMIKMKKAIFTHFDIIITQDNGKVLNCEIIPRKPVTIVPNKKIRYTYQYTLKDFSNKTKNELIKSTQNRKEIIFNSNYLLIITEIIIVSLFLFYNLSTMYQIDKQTGEKYFVWCPLHGDIFRNPLFEKAFCIIIGIICHLSFTFMISILYYIVFNSKEPTNFNNNLISTQTILSTFFMLLKFTAIIQGFITTCFCNNFFIEESLKITIFSMILENILLFLIFIPLHNSGKKFSSVYSFVFDFSNFIHFIIHNMILSLINSFIGYIVSHKYNLLGTATCETMPFPKIDKKPPFLLKFPFSFLIFGLIIGTSISKQYVNLLLSFWDENQYNVSITSLINSIFLITILSSLLSLYITTSRVQNRSPHWQWNTLLSPFSIVIVLFYFSYKIEQRIHVIFNSFNHVLFVTYSFIISLIITLLCSASSYLSSLFFLRFVFSNKKGE